MEELEPVKKALGLFGREDEVVRSNGKDVAEAPKATVICIGGGAG